MAPLKYVLLDCDNTLVISEKLAFEACADLTNEVLEKHGVSDRYTGHELLGEFVGHNFRGMLNGLQKKYGFEMKEDELDEYVDQELGRVTAKLREKAEPCEGVFEQLENIKKHYPLAVVSTSAKTRVVASLEKAGLDHYFPNEHVYSAATSMEKPSSKPDPAIYLYACEQLGVKPEECLTVEDSKSGATSAMRAGVPLIGYVGIYKMEEGDEKMNQMAKLLTEECGAKAIMYHWSEFSECVRRAFPDARV